MIIICVSCRTNFHSQNIPDSIQLLFRTHNDSLYTLHVDVGAGEVLSSVDGGFNFHNILIKETDKISSGNIEWNSIIWNGDTLLLDTYKKYLVGENSDRTILKYKENLSVQYADSLNVIFRYTLNFYDGAGSGINYNRSIIMSVGIDFAVVSDAIANFDSEQQKFYRQQFFQRFNVGNVTEQLDNEFIEIEILQEGLKLNYNDVLKNECNVLSENEKPDRVTYIKEENVLWFSEINKFLKMPSYLKGSILIGRL